ncbi:MAG: chemotaxis protein MotB [Candidatus Margulisiibacteriota bacterium]|nr:MAG: chemotaxis protein MotB [Candidatus Margulisbacteria bacterium GWD2_39_127]OGI05212.1 MAG: chemotaxis protein MotB [Candidatus Margulisbacteria bacterium GWF2_38_17]OGI06261.1 MAG: chemotaxis protein MotB [Candidatus Margulisbacteria bacterium GWE2_39_32]PZM78918.1 MAG: chemotaxis protein MotB [Candidatus Margulisiibacteriota bacterium]HAR64498.1 chemotaxis protein MotB [Candidatus Margulisiibacteriota bacterium]
MRKKHEEKPVNHERWLLTYADLITLLMIFFVVLYALSMLDASKYKQLSESLKISLGVGTPEMTNFEGGQITPYLNTPQSDEQDMKKYFEELQKQNEAQREQEAMEAYKLEEVKGVIDKYLEENKMTANVSTQLDDRGLVIRVNETLLFDSGQSYIKSEFSRRLIDLGKILNKTDNYIRIEGHTDNVPISNDQYRSNWQLSTARATNVTELLIHSAGMAPKRLSAVGYAEFRPIAINTSFAGKTKNRRVDILIINSKYNSVEGNK